MPANVEINSVTANGLARAYPNIAFHTEDGANPYNINHFSFAGGASTYTFGVYQFDVGNNPSAASFLEENGFTSQQVSELSQHGGLSSATLSSLNSELQSVLNSSSGQASYQDLIATSTNSYITGLQTAIDDASDTIRSAIISDPVAEARIMDIENQFSPRTIAALDTFLGGDPVTPPGGSNIQYDYSKSATENLSDFFFATAFGASNSAVTRDNQFDSAIGTTTLPTSVVDISAGTGADANVANLPNLSNATVNLDNGTSVTLSGTASNDTLTCGNKTSDISSVSAPTTFQCTVSPDGAGTITDTTSNASIDLGAGSQMSFSGSNDTITAGQESFVSLGDDFSGDIYVSDATIIASPGDDFSIFGNNDIIEGQDDFITITGYDDQADVNGSHLVAYGSNDSFYGYGDTGAYGYLLTGGPTGYDGGGGDGGENQGVIPSHSGYAPKEVGTNAVVKGTNISSISGGDGALSVSGTDTAASHDWGRETSFTHADDSHGRVAGISPVVRELQGNHVGPSNHQVGGVLLAGASNGARLAHALASFGPAAGSLSSLDHQPSPGSGVQLAVGRHTL